MALKTSLGDFEGALAANDILIKFSKETREKNRLKINAAEVAYYSFVSDKTSVNENDIRIRMKAALSSLDEAGGSLAGKLSFLQKYAGFERENGEFENAQKIYKRGLSLLENASYDDIEKLETMGKNLYGTPVFSKEWFLAESMITAFQGKDSDKANEFLNLLIACDNRRTPPSFFFYEGLCQLDPKNGHAFRNEATKWLKDRPKDTWTSNLELHLARSYIAEKLFPQAMRIYGNLLSKYNADYTSGIKDVEPRIIEVSLGLATCLEELGQLEESKKVVEKVQKRFGSTTQKVEIE